MGKKILVITASPRRNGNTDKMADAFIKGAIEAGHHPVKFEAGHKKIGGCTACGTCWSNGSACSIMDDFQELEPLLESCEVLLLASPLYWFSFPAQVKGAIDRLYAYGGTGGSRKLAIKESYLFLCGGDSEKEEYEPVMNIFERISKYLGWETRGILQTGGMEEKGAIEESGVLWQAEELGREV